MIDYPSEDIKTAAQLLSQDGIVVFPCDTIWGLIARPSKKAISKIQALKQRAITSPFILLIPDEDYLDRLVQSPLDRAVLRLISRMWPGPYTIVFKKSAAVSDQLTGGRPTVGIRCPRFGPLNQLLHHVNGPLISTSLNQSGFPPIENIHDLPPEFGQVDYIFKGASPPLNAVSTVIDVTTAPFQVLREGSDPAGLIRDLAPRLQPK